MAFILAYEHRMWVEYSVLIFGRLRNKLRHCLLKHTRRYLQCTYSVVKYPFGVIESTVV